MNIKTHAELKEYALENPDVLAYYEQDQLERLWPNLDWEDASGIRLKDDSFISLRRGAIKVFKTIEYMAPQPTTAKTVYDFYHDFSIPEIRRIAQEDEFRPKEFFSTEQLIERWTSPYIWISLEAVLYEDNSLIVFGEKLLFTIDNINALDDGSAPAIAGLIEK